MHYICPSLITKGRKIKTNVINFNFIFFKLKGIYKNDEGF